MSVFSSGNFPISTTKNLAEQVRGGGICFHFEFQGIAVHHGGEGQRHSIGVASCDAVPRLYLDQHGTRGRHRSPGPAPGGSLSPAIPSVPKAPQISMTGLHSLGWSFQMEVCV